MDEGARRRWAQALVVLALLLGVAAMHAVVAPMATGHSTSAAPAAHSASAMAEALMVDGPGPVGGSATTSGGPADPAAPMPAAHNLMHLCLAVLAAAAAVASIMFMIMARSREMSAAAPRRTRPVTVAARPPPRTAVRLAQLCVLRN